MAQKFSGGDQYIPPHPRRIRPISTRELNCPMGRVHCFDGGPFIRKRGSPCQSEDVFIIHLTFPIISS